MSRCRLRRIDRLASRVITLSQAPALATTSTLHRRIIEMALANCATWRGSDGVANAEEIIISRAKTEEDMALLKEASEMFNENRLRTWH